MFSSAPPKKHPVLQGCRSWEAGLFLQRDPHDPCDLSSNPWFAGGKDAGGSAGMRGRQEANMPTYIIYIMCMEMSR